MRKEKYVTPFIFPLCAGFLFAPVEAADVAVAESAAFLSMMMPESADAAADDLAGYYKEHKPRASDPGVNSLPRELTKSGEFSKNCAGGEVISGKVSFDKIKGFNPGVKGGVDRTGVSGSFL